MRSAVLLCAVLLGLTSPARAVIVYGGDGTQNTTPPGNGAPWDHVGTIGGATGVYLGGYDGGYWVATASHVGAGDITLNGVTYSVASGSSLQVSGSDLTLFRITANPGLSNLTLSSSAPAAGAAVTMIGNGVNRGTDQLYWSVSGTTWTQLPDSSGANASGYAWSSGNAMRWGTNVIAGTDTYNIGTGNTTALYTTFSNGVLNEAQGATGDSGGGMFYYNGSSWELLGIMGAIATFDGQPGSTAVFGNATYAASIPAYYSAITSAIPEPADVAWWCGAVIAVVAMVRRRRR
jgi:hypothetical protein